MKNLKIAMFSFAALAVAAPNAQAQQDLDGSDTLINVINNLVNPTGDLAAAIADVTGGAGCGNINYLGNGSGDGETAVCDGKQQVTPMSRMFDKEVVCNAECDGYDASVDVQGVSIAGDAITVLRNHGNTDMNTCVSMTGVETLRLIYGGTDGSGTRATCDTDERRDFISKFTDCAGSECPDGLANAFRRGDSSGTTKVFMDLVGITGFCNGNQNEDLDPVRRDCTDADRICSPDGKLGIVLPIFIDADTGFEPMEINNANPCGFSAFDYARPPLALGPASCPYGPEQNAIGGLCAYPIDANGDFGCQAQAGFINKPSLAAGDPSFDPREYNLVPRSKTGRIALDARIDGSKPDFTYRASPFYRIAAGCAEGVDSTTQIGCIVEATDCSIGFGGRSLDAFSQDTSNNVASVKIDGKSISDEGYPLTRKLYFNSIKGFGNVGALPAEERELTECILNDTPVASIGNRTILQEAARLAGFTPVAPTETATPVNTCD